MAKRKSRRKHNTATAQTVLSPIEIIAKKMIHRSSHDGEMACGHRIGESDAAAILMALKNSGYLIITVPTEVRQIQLDHDCPGLWIGFKSTEDRARIAALLEVVP